MIDVLFWFWAGGITAGLGWVAWASIGSTVARHWLASRRLPAIMRHGTPRDGGRGTPELSAMPLDATRIASLGPPSRPELVTPLEWRAMQAQQRHDTPEDRVRRAMAERAWRDPW